MRTQIRNNVFVVKFGYDVKETIIERGSVVYHIDQVVTTCYIKKPLEGTAFEMISEESVAADSRDKFEKSKGRTLAFKKALSVMFNSKEIREKYDLRAEDFSKFVHDFYEQCPSSKKFK